MVSGQGCGETNFSVELMVYAKQFTSEQSVFGNGKKKTKRFAMRIALGISCNGK